MLKAVGLKYRLVGNIFEVYYLFEIEFNCSTNHSGFAYYIAKYSQN